MLRPAGLLLVRRLARRVVLGPVGMVLARARVLSRVALAACLLHLRSPTRFLS
jgi:hypothetical protein